jgi:hypothetical protein
MTKQGSGAMFAPAARGSRIEEFIPRMNPELEMQRDRYKLARNSALQPEDVIKSIEQELQEATPGRTKK